MNYAGDISSAEAWEALKSDSTSKLIDVRTKAELNFVGMPDLKPLDKELVWAEWQFFPGGEINSNFVNEILEHITSSTKMYLLCRSGQRSKSAAIALTKLGYKYCFNIADGFEGELDCLMHRGQNNGWKSSGLPWLQS